MNAAFASRSRTPSGIARLLDDFDALARATAERDGSARSRLESELGSELARRLVGALASGPRRAGLLAL